MFSACQVQRSAAAVAAVEWQSSILTRHFWRLFSPFDAIKMAARYLALGRDPAPQLQRAAWLGRKTHVAPAARTATPAGQSNRSCSSRPAPPPSTLAWRAKQPTACRAHRRASSLGDQCGMIDGRACSPRVNCVRLGRRNARQVDKNDDHKGALGQSRNSQLASLGAGARLKRPRLAGRPSLFAVCRARGAKARCSLGALNLSSSGGRRGKICFGPMPPR